VKVKKVQRKESLYVCKECDIKSQIDFLCCLLPSQTSRINYEIEAFRTKHILQIGRHANDMLHIARMLDQGAPCAIGDSTAAITQLDFREILTIGQNWNQTVVANVATIPETQLDKLTAMRSDSFQLIVAEMLRAADA